MGRLVALVVLLAVLWIGLAGALRRDGLRATGSAVAPATAATLEPGGAADAPAEADRETPLRRAATSLRPSVSLRWVDERGGPLRADRFRAAFVSFGSRRRVVFEAPESGPGAPRLEVGRHLLAAVLGEEPPVLRSIALVPGDHAIAVVRCGEVVAARTPGGPGVELARRARAALVPAGIESVMRDRGALTAWLREHERQRVRRTRAARRMLAGEAREVSVAEFAAWRSAAEVPTPLEGLAAATPAAACAAWGSARLLASEAVDGALRWSGIPAHSSARVVLLEPAQGRPEPLAAWARDPGRSVRELRERVSAAFEVEAGTTSELRWSVPGLGAVRGTCGSGGRPPTGGRVRVMERLVTREAGVRWQEEAQGNLDAVGGFRLAPLVPGEKTLVAHWTDGEGRVSFARVPFRVPEGGLVELGSLVPSAGHSVRVTVRRVDDAGRPLGAWRRESGPWFLHVSAQASEADGSTGVQDVVELRAGAPTELIGLGPGWWAFVLVRPGAPLARDRSSSSESTGILGQRVIEVTGDTEIVFEWKEPRRVQVPVRVVVPPGLRPRSLCFSGRRDETARSFESTTQELRASGAGVYETRVALPLGGSTLLAHTFERFSAVEGPCGVWTGSVFVDGSTVQNGLELRLEIGATWSGEARASDGRLAARTVLMFGPSWLATADPPRHPYRVRTDERGSFVVHGLPPHAELTGHGWPAPLRTGAPGEEAPVTVWLE